jgi:NAD(P)-dependent dehydrogenase (short-subunit alcohol dehydrogenase family)
MSKNIEGKVVVITGASSGLGESTARHLADLGATYWAHVAKTASTPSSRTSPRKAAMRWQSLLT